MKRTNLEKMFIKVLLKKYILKLLSNFFAGEKYNGTEVLLQKIQSRNNEEDADTEGDRH